jgi:hypothetical protein
MIVTDRIVLHRRGDPQNEYRELLLCEDQEYWFTVYQIIGFARTADFYHREELGTRTEREMRTLFCATAAQLCQEGFSVCAENPSRCMVLFCEFLLSS